MKVYLIKDFNTNEYMSPSDWRYTKNPCFARIYHSLHYATLKIKRLSSWYRSNKNLRVMVFDMSLENEREYIDGIE